MNKYIYKLMSCVAVFLLLFGPGLTVQASSLDDTRSKVDEIQQEINRLQSSLNEKRGQVNSLRGELAYINDQIAAIQSQINLLDRQISLTNKQINDINAQIAKAENDLKAQQDVLKEYLIELYTSGNTTTLEMIAGSASFSEYLNRMEYVETLQEAVNNGIENVKKLQEELKTKKADLDKQGAQLKKLQDDQVQKRRVIDIQRQKTQDILSQTQGQESEYKKQIAEAQQREAAAWAQYQDALNRSTGNSASHYLGGSGNGYLSSPSGGVLTQGYGCTEFAMCGNPSGPYGGNIHNGIDVSYGYAGPIRAAAEGVVLDAGYEYNSGGWGNWIAIKHPNGLVTFYGHMSSFAVSPGMGVSRGQTIGYEGWTGNAWPKGPGGSHLHFSVYTNFVLYTGAYHGPAYSGTANPFNFL